MECKRYLNPSAREQSKHDCEGATNPNASGVEVEENIVPILIRLINLPPDKIEVEMVHILKTMAKYVGADRCYLILTSDEGKTIAGTYEWCDVGIEPQIKHLNKFLLEIFGWEWDILTKREPISIPRVADLPPGAFTGKRLLRALDIQSLLLIPLTVVGPGVALLGVDSIRSEKKWGNEEIELLKGVGEAIATILAHREADRTLKDSLQKLQRIKKEWESTADSLSELVFLVDHRGLIIRSNRAVENWRLGSVLSVKGRKMHEILHPSCANPACIFETNLPKVWKELRQNYSVKWEFPDKILKRYLSVQIRPISVIIEGNEKISFAVVVINNITGYKRKEREQEKLVHDLQSRLSQDKTLWGLLPICASCKKIRDEKGDWNEIEIYIRDRSNVEFTHGICPECIQKLYPELIQR